MTKRKDTLSPQDLDRRRRQEAEFVSDDVVKVCRRLIPYLKKPGVLRIVDKYDDEPDYIAVINPDNAWFSIFAALNKAGKLPELELALTKLFKPQGWHRVGVSYHRYENKKGIGPWRKIVSVDEGYGIHFRRHPMRVNVQGMGMVEVD